MRNQAAPARLTRGTAFLFAGLLAALLAACGGGGGGSGNGPSPQPVPVPGAPTGLTVVAGNAQVALTWAAVSGATSYHVYRSTTAGQAGSRVGTTSSSSYTDTTALNGTTYLYQVTAVNAGGEGQPSPQSSGVTPSAPVILPAAPSGVAATRNAVQVTVT